MQQHIRATHALFLHVQQLRREENETVGSKSLWDVDGHATTRRDRLRPTANVASSLLSVSQAYRLRMLDHIKAVSVCERGWAITLSCCR